MAETTLNQIVSKLHHLPEAKLLEVLDFVEFLRWQREGSTSKQGRVEVDNSLQEDEQFEEIANDLANEFEAFVGSNVPVLSDYAVSRAGIYEEHP